jgi:5-(carboxyamino)imidazole ribonucleotide synthase
VTTLGVLGGGQLGRLLALDARAHDIRVVVRTDEVGGGPAEQVADLTFRGAYDDELVNDLFADQCDAITAEFENLPTMLLERFAEDVPVRPSAASIGICQHRRREKEFLAANGFAHAPFEVVQSSDQLVGALTKFDGRAILKTAAFGYDGKGQRRFDPELARADLAVTEESILEAFVPFVRELSVVGARSVDGTWVPFAVGENVHMHGILDHTIAPARVSEEVATNAQATAGRIAVALGHVGAIGVEFFLLADDSLVVNEMAPRPHNSGHHTIDACVTSQFGQQWRAALGRDLGDPTQHTPAVMVNLLGDQWVNGEPNWSTLGPDARLHLYGKADPRPGRKMGHITFLDTSPEDALAARARLTC